MGLLREVDVLGSEEECMQKGEPFTGPDDESGWVWAVADLTVEGGLNLELRRSTPLGMRALMVARAGNAKEMFESVSWHAVRQPGSTWKA